MSSKNRADTIRAIFAAYLSSNRKLVEDVLSDDFRFTSPYDDNIDKPTYLTIPETSIIIEYLDRHYRGPTRFIPDDAALALQTRLRDRFYDLYVHLPMQQIVGNRLRAEGNKDPHGVEEARDRLRTAYAMIEQQMAAGGWAMGGDFSLADCAAAPALFYGNRVEPFGEAHRNVRAYLERLAARPSFARVLKEAEPWFQMFPKES